MDESKIIRRIMNDMKVFNVGELNFMEVCGTHTYAVSHSGIRKMIPSNITLLSGPGCPVCVTDESQIDAALEMINKHDVILVTFGDMVRVKGTNESLLDQMDKRENIIVTCSPLESLEIARKELDKEVVFFAVGFETTAPLIALAVKGAYENKLNNLSFLICLKLMPPILEKILAVKQKKVDGIICPGHVAAVKGATYFSFISKKYGIPAVISGFEALDIALGLYYLTKQHTSKDPAQFRNLYKLCVNERGNKFSEQLIKEVFDIETSKWRGIGMIEDSALRLADKYSYFDALKRFNIKINKSLVPQKCECKDVLLGNILPHQCNLFRVVCNPEEPKGPCMVSGEGACSIYYRYGGDD